MAIELSTDTEVQKWAAEHVLGWIWEDPAIDMGGYWRDADGHTHNDPRVFEDWQYVPGLIEWCLANGVKEINVTHTVDDYGYDEVHTNCQLWDANSDTMRDAGVLVGEHEVDGDDTGRELRARWMASWNLAHKEMNE